MKAFIDTYGRTSNISDSAAMRQALLDSGWMIVGSAEEADVVIINTCAVTGHTARSMWKMPAPRMYRFAHIPVQSRSDRILRLMNRPYTAAQYEHIVGLLRDCVPDITFSTDYTAGFPTESPGDHSLTMENLRNTRPLKVNITRYSPRPGTSAVILPDTLERTKKERSRALTSLHHEVTSSFMKSMPDVTITGSSIKYMIGKK